jgi:hypothetical protein
LEGEAPTSAWQPGEVYYDAHRLHVPADLAPGTYRLGVRVYWYGDGEPLPVSEDGAEAGDAALLGTVQVRAG